MTTAYSPGEGGAQVRIMSPTDASGEPMGQPTQQQGKGESSLTATAETSNAGPVVSWVRNSPYTIEEVGLMIDAVYLAAFIAVFYMGVSE